MIDQSRERLTEPPVFVPTGVLIDSLRFDGGTDVDVRGLHLAEVRLRGPRRIDRGVSLAGVAAQRIGEPQVERSDGVEVVRWPFEVSQRVRFENSKYPLMRERFALRVVPRAISSNLAARSRSRGLPDSQPGHSARTRRERLSAGMGDHADLLRTSGASYPPPISVSAAPPRTRASLRSTSTSRSARSSWTPLFRTWCR